MNNSIKNENIRLYKEVKSLMDGYRKELDKSVASMKQDFGAVPEDSSIRKGDVADERRPLSL